MKLIPDPNAASWLADLVVGEDHFDWDMGNRGKSERKHGVSDGEIEFLLSARLWLFNGRIVSPDHGEWRGLLLGETHNGRLLALIFTRREDQLRPISCRPMRLEEKMRYVAAKTQA